MSGYREHNFDPNAGFQEGQGLRPYDNWQRAGVVSIVLGMLLLTVSAIVDLGGWDDRYRLPGAAVFGFALGGIVLMHYRQAPSDRNPSPEMNERGRLVCGVVLIVSGAIVLGLKVGSLGGVLR